MSILGGSGAVEATNARVRFSTTMAVFEGGAILQRQRTLKYPVTLTGVGVHTGRTVKAVVRPAPVDSGVVFFRTDLEGDLPIPAMSANVVCTELATSIGIKGSGHTVSTIEHLLSALYGLGIANAIVDVNGPEFPILDGSAAPIVEALLSAGTRVQHKSKRCIIVERRVRVEENGKWAEVIPSRSFKITCSIDYKHPLINDQKYSLQFTDARYVKEICRARTFGFLDQVEYLRSRGFALGGSLDNAVVIDDYNILNEEGLRYPDEFVRHKVLDTLGDLAVCGAVLVGHFRSSRSGHTLNQKLVGQLLKSRNAYELVNAHDVELAREMPVELPDWSDSRELLPITW
jgi:UDP-3-O-[3-hydroxymyristoyl] N-acetylglucosamine deacetylase